MATDTNVGKWDRWYSLVDQPEPYGDVTTYRLGAEWLAGCDRIEDWGCGKGWLRTLIEPDRYYGVDGSHTPYADLVTDLAGYRSTTSGLFLRHVLEHDPRWRNILTNAVASFTERMALILFTPLADRTHDLEWEDDPGVPNLAFSLDDIAEHLVGVRWTHETLATASKYGVETIFRVER